MKQNKIFIYGKHAVLEALEHARHAVTRIYLDTRVVEKKLAQEILRSGVPVAKFAEGFSRADLHRGAAHQGLIGQLSQVDLTIPFEHFMEDPGLTPDTAIVLMAGIQDPHNVGAIIRSAAAFGAKAVIMPLHNQAPVTATVIQVSAGTALRIPLVLVKDPETALNALKAKGCKAYGLTGDGKHPLAEEKFNAPSVFVLGSEGMGLPREIRALCDGLLSIPMSSRAESLNVAAAAATTLYVWSQQHSKALM